MADTVAPTATTASIDIDPTGFDTNPILEAPIPAIAGDTAGFAEQQSLSAGAVAEPEPAVAVCTTACDAQAVAPTDATPASQEAELQHASRDNERCRLICQTEAEVCTCMGLAFQ